MTKHNHAKLSAKKAAILENKKRKMNPIPILLGALALLSAGAFGYHITSSKTQAPQAQVDIARDNSQIVHPVSMFEDGMAHHFEYKTGDLTIRYFIIKSSDGVVRAAFDACDVCWPAGKGYYQEGDYMVCRNCGRRFASVQVNEVQGGCNPAPLNRVVQGDKLILKAEDIVQSKTYFNLNGKV